MTGLLLLAVEEEDVSAGPLGLLILLLMLVATVLLIRNMSSRIKRLPKDFPDQDSGQDSDQDEDRPAPRD